jgi:hypothetical protein
MENQKEKVEEHVRMDVDALKAAVEHVRNKSKNDEKMRKKSFFHLFHEQDDILGRIRQRFPQFMNSAHQITDYLPSLSSTKSRVSSVPQQGNRGNFRTIGNTYKAPSQNSNTNSRSYSDDDDQHRYLSEDPNLLRNKGQSDPNKIVARGSVLSTNDKRTLQEYGIEKDPVEKSIRKRRAEKERETVTSGGAGGAAVIVFHTEDQIKHFSEKTNPHEIPRSFSLPADGKEGDPEEGEDVEAAAHRSRGGRESEEEERKLDSSGEDIFNDHNTGAMLVLGNNQGIIPDRPGTVSMVNPEFFFESTRGSGGAGGGGGSHQVGRTRRSGGESGRDEEDGGLTGLSSSRKEKTAGGRDDDDGVRGSKRIITSASRSRSRSEGEVQSNFGGEGSLNGEIPLNDEELQEISDKNRKSIEEKEGDKEISSNFPLGMPILYFEIVQILILLTSLYLALWVTNFVVAADTGMLFPSFCLFFAHCLSLLLTVACLLVLFLSSFLPSFHSSFSSLSWLESINTSSWSW